MTPGYQRALESLGRFVNYEQVPPAVSEGCFRLEPMRQILEAMGSPERRWPAIHVAGTKGKGSTCALLAAILQAAGVRVGLYTSPHLVNLRERIQVDGHWISEQAFADAVDLLQAAVTHLPTPPTYFEALTAVAFWLFARQAVEIAVVEVGLGGRLDATNVLDPLLSIITPVSYDHTDLLGTTLAAIAGEKAGIIKPARPVIVAPQSPEALAVILAAAAARGAPCVEVDTQVDARVSSASVEGQQVLLRTTTAAYPVIPLPLLGAHQVMNLATAVVALEQQPIPWRVPIAAVAQGAAQVQWPGRIQILERHPWLVVDGAQNAASAEALCRTVRALWPRARIHLVLGVSANKDVAGVAQALAPLTGAVIATQASTPRALPAAELASRVRRWFPAVEVSDAVGEAVAIARRRACSDDCIVVAGSLFLVGELLQEACALHG